jgi:hypothetical protein
MSELHELLTYVRDHQDIDTRQVIEAYLNQFVWSILKDEWDNRMCEEERRLFTLSVKRYLRDHKR